MYFHVLGSRPLPAPFPLFWISQLAGAFYPVEGILIAHVQSNLYGADPGEVRNGSHPSRQSGGGGGGEHSKKSHAHQRPRAWGRVVDIDILMVYRTRNGTRDLGHHQLCIAGEIDGG